MLAHCAGIEPPEWACAALDDLVKTMDAASHREAGVERAVVNAVECIVLAPHIGERFDGVVVDRNHHGVIVQLRRPAIVAPMAADVALGEAVQVTVAAVDVPARRVELALAQRSDGTL